MDTREFYFNLPSNLIAQYPSKERGASRLMVLDPGRHKVYHDRSVNDMLKYIDSNIFLVFNDSRVRKSRIYAKTDSGGSVEFLILDRIADDVFTCLVSKSRRQNVGKIYKFPQDLLAQIISKSDNEFTLKFSKCVDEAYFEQYGLIPLPPYIKRTYEKEDEERYRTIYSKCIGSSASATAGLHFGREFFSLLDKNSIEYDFITLHVGLGTFLPVRTKKIEEHKMHFERFFIKDSVAMRLKKAMTLGKKILAVGTTTLRTLESAYKGSNEFMRGEQKTDLFIYPGKGYGFKCVDMLFTNFHTPGSTLLMLVSSFGGKDFVFNSYKEAVEMNYKFFSYGDATLFLNHI
ncbi:tRNA preQ1(34) S-adenosylmethionine ribosyltransferase-isomerase QueA [Borrelia sp. BU AG58]|uniref:tRNA preQ1(34) S-adenosylmethionine ribosyltransferase-isomerase QueA n=1 Tax=Borrelia sp. BU AG58 TaxID=2887345 RepID=UPI001E331520|nr:tRNA preQ1(34) S-adenosylmethionine ribosyltransferase-isomerase QueA [Borrelia sp. BU AG58]UER67983.1 tRNA preQ1(34) S-adenosylmethionine ribosyltransferase-isomerase QueA [Borrelia sp. BU AG58]